jgi:hypothetical protein
MTNTAAAAQQKLTYIQSEPLSLKLHPEFDESWLEKQIKEHPEVLDLASARVVSSQAHQKHGGIVDLLLKDEGNEVFYTVELMLGAVDASHIVRTIDYFLREQTRPEAEDWTHVAVLVAEDIRGSRFLNVVEYLSRNMPLIVMELSALRIGQYVTLKSVRIFDGTQEREGAIEEQEEITRESWIKKSSPESIQLVDKFEGILQKLSDGLRLTYKKFFIGIAKGNIPENFVAFSPKRAFVRVNVKRIGNAAEWNKRIHDAGFHLLEGGEGVKFRVFPDQFEEHRDLFAELFKQAHTEWFENE